MTTASFGRAPFALPARGAWVWAIVVGALSVAVGIVGLVYAGLATLASVLFFGWLMIIGGAMLLGQAFTIHSSERRVLSALGGVLYIIVGLLLISHPLLSAESLTLLMGAFFLAGGVFRIGVAATSRLTNRGWMLVNGVVLVVLGLLVLGSWPLSGIWLIGTYVSIGFILEGSMLLALGMEIRRHPEAPPESRPAAAI